MTTHGHLECLKMLEGDKGPPGRFWKWTTWAIWNCHEKLTQTFL